MNPPDSLESGGFFIWDLLFIWEHKNKRYEGFTKRYNVTKPVCLESFRSIEDAIDREKQIKAGSRQKKLDLINDLNPQWDDLYKDLLP